jgi:putative Mn2+ efflux pump MntP
MSDFVKYGRDLVSKGGAKVIYEMHRERVSIAATVLASLLLMIAVFACAPAVSNDPSTMMSVQEMSLVEGAGRVSRTASVTALVTGLAIVAIGVACIANPVVGVAVMGVLFSASTPAAAVGAAVGFTAFGGLSAGAGYLGLKYDQFLP